MRIDGSIRFEMKRIVGGPDRRVLERFLGADQRRVLIL